MRLMRIEPLDWSTAAADEIIADLNALVRSVLAPICGERFPGYPGTRCGLHAGHDGDHEQRGGFVKWGAD